MTWLLFIPYTPATPDYLRVKLRRTLFNLGTIPIKGAVYTLPHLGDCLEKLAGAREELRQDGGEAVICSAGFITGMSDEALIAAFNQDRTSRYAEIREQALLQPPGRRWGTVNRLKRRLKGIVAIDFFAAEGRADAENAIRVLATSYGDVAR